MSCCQYCMPHAVSDKITVRVRVHGESDGKKDNSHIANCFFVKRDLLSTCTLK